MVTRFSSQLYLKSHQGHSDIIFITSKQKENNLVALCYMSSSLIIVYFELIFFSSIAFGPVIEHLSLVY
jgi:hypothetical protein